MRRNLLTYAQIALIFTLSSTCMVTLAANEIDNLQPGHWYEVPNSQLRKLCPSDNAQGHGYQWSLQCSGLINAWNGGAYDSKRNRLMVWGGGHADYAGNEVYAFDVNSLSWQQITQPSELTGSCDGYGWNGECPSGEEMPDGNPISRHTYDSLEYVPGLDILWAAGGSRWSSGAISEATWILNLANKSWVRKTDRPETSWYYTFFSVYDPVTKNIFSYGTDSLLMYNPVSGKWTELTSGESPISDGVTAELDPDRRILVVVGDGIAKYYDLSDLANVTSHVLPSSGDKAIEQAKAPGLVYDASIKAMVAWSGNPAAGLRSEDVYVLDLDTFKWTKRAPAVTNTVIPAKATANGTYGRFRYIPSKNAFVVVNDVDQNVYFYKLPASKNNKQTDSAEPVQVASPFVEKDKKTVTEPLSPTRQVADSGGSVISNTVDTMQPGSWYEVPNSQLNQQCLGDNAQKHGFSWSSYCAELMNAWGAGALDVINNRLMVWGGGHGQYPASEAFGFDINTLSWNSIAQPDYLSNGKLIDSQDYNPYLDVFWTTEGSRWSKGGLSNITWTRKTDRPEKSWYYTHLSVFDPVTKNVLSVSKGSLLMHNPATNQWTELAKNDTPLTDGMTAELDPVRRKLVVIGEGLAFYYDLSDLQNVTRKQLKAGGDNKIIYAKVPGLAYNAAGKTMVAWNADPAIGLLPEDVYELDFDALKWTRHSPANGSSVAPSTSNERGAYGRFRYIPSKNAFIVVSAVDKNVYFYKLPTAGRVASSNTNTPVVNVNAADVKKVEPVVQQQVQQVKPTLFAGSFGPGKSDPQSVRLFSETTGSGELPSLTVMAAHPAHIADINHVNELVSVGIPLQKGSGITSVAQLKLQGASAAQFKALSHYPNGEIRWLDIDFITTVSAGATSQVSLAKRLVASVDPDLAQVTANGVTVKTGVARFDIDADSSSILSSAMVGGKQQLADSMIVYSIQNGQEYTSLSDDNTQVSIEKNGPVTTIVRVDGRLKNSNGAGHFWYTARLHFVKNTADIKTELTIRNASKQVLSAQNFDAYGVRFVMENPNPDVTFVMENGERLQGRLDAQQSALLYQGYVQNHPFNQKEVRDCYLWKPPAAGNCSSDYVYTYAPAYKGVNVVISGETALQGGNNRSAAFASVESGNQKITLAQRWMANYFPASFEIDASGQVDIGLHSRYSGKPNQSINWGGHQTREFTIAFARANSAIVRHQLDWPLVARANFDYYRRAKAMLGENRMVSFEEEESYFAKYNGFEPESIKSVSTPEFKVKRYTHWRRHYTDYLKDIVDFWRGGDPMYMAGVLQSLDYEVDAAIAHSDGFDLAQNLSLTIPRGEERGINKYDSEHQLTRYLPIGYYLTGNERVHEAILDYGEDQLFDERANYFQFPETPFFRAWLRRFENFSWLYGFTEDTRYLNEVKSGVDFLVSAKAVDGERETRGQDKARGFLNMSVAEGFNERVIHNFFGAQISGDTYFHVMRMLRQTGINYKIEDLEDVVLGHAYFLFREMMHNEDGTTSGIGLDYYLDQSNQSSGFEDSLYVADRYLQHIYDMFGVDSLDGVDLFEQAYQLDYVRGTSVPIPGLMANGQQQALMYTDMFRPVPKHGYASVDTTVTRNDDDSYTLSWIVPEGAKRYRIKASLDKPIVEWLGYGKTSQQFALSPDSFMPWFAAKNLQGEPKPKAAGTVQTWTVRQLPDNGTWFFDVQYSTQKEMSGIL